MNSARIKILLIILIFMLGCSDRSLFTDPGDPNLGGVFTTINGDLSGTLLKNKSPYLVSEKISVPSGVTLTIEPGTLIFFKPSAGFFISGGLRAIGTKEQPIVLQGFGNSWIGIHSENSTDSLIFKYCNIEEIYLPVEREFDYGGVEISNANVVFKNCYFYFNYSRYGGALSIFFCNSEIMNNIFYDNESVDYGGAILSQNSSNKIINNTFYKNICSNFGSAISIVDPVNEDIQNNIFYKNFSFRDIPPIFLLSGDSTKVLEQFNYLDPDSLTPQFISTSDFHLQQNSPCINAGNPSPEFNDSNGTRNDQGAYGGPDGNW